MSSDKKILFIHNPVGEALVKAVLEKYADIVEFTTPEDAVSRAGQFDALMTLDKTPLPGLWSGTRLNWVHAQSHGFYQLVDDELRAHRATVTNARGCHPESVAEHVFAMLLALTRRLPEYSLRQAEHKWQRYTMNTLYNKTMCIVGAGNIGQAVAQRAKAFGMRVHGVDVLPVVCESVDTLSRPKELDRALFDADVVVISVPFNDSTAGMFSAKRLKEMKPGAFLINISRGGIVDETALIALLQSGQIAGAGFDVFSREPLPADDPIWDAQNIIILPHSASQTELSRSRLIELVLEQIRRYLEGEPLINVVKPGIVP